MTLKRDDSRVELVELRLTGRNPRTFTNETLGKARAQQLFPGDTLEVSVQGKPWTTVRFRVPLLGLPPKSEVFSVYREEDSNPTRLGLMGRGTLKIKITHRVVLVKAPYFIF